MDSDDSTNTQSEDENEESGENQSSEEEEQEAASTVVQEMQVCTPETSTETQDSRVTLSERQTIRKQLSEMSFEDLQKLRQKIGAKKYDKVMFGEKVKKPAKDFKRANKNRPREMSSKRPDNIIEMSKRLKPRDPRFDPLCGTYDEKTFKSNYRFLKDVRKNEKTQLVKELKNETDPKRKQKIKFVMQRLDNQIREQEKREKEIKNKQQEKQNIKKQLMEGKKPVFKKKSEKRIEDLVNKYEELKKTNKLKKHMERKYKKLAKKDRKNMGTGFT